MRESVYDFGDGECQSRGEKNYFPNETTAKKLVLFSHPLIPILCLVPLLSTIILNIYCRMCGSRPITETKPKAVPNY